jgi:hypothetical protein
MAEDTPGLDNTNAIRSLSFILLQIPLDDEASNSAYYTTTRDEPPREESRRTPTVGAKAAAERLPYSHKVQQDDSSSC